MQLCRCHKTMGECRAYLELLLRVLHGGLSCKGLPLAELNSVVTLLDLGLKHVLWSAKHVSIAYTAKHGGIHIKPY